MRSTAARPLQRPRRRPRLLRPLTLPVSLACARDEISIHVQDCGTRPITCPILPARTAGPVGGHSTSALGASALASVFVMANCTVGAGVLSLPFAFQATGERDHGHAGHRRCSSSLPTMLPPHGQEQHALVRSWLWFSGLIGGLLLCSAVAVIEVRKAAGGQVWVGTKLRRADSYSPQPRKPGPTVSHLRVSTTRRG